MFAKRSEQKTVRGEVTGTQVFERSQKVGLHRQDVVKRYSEFRRTNETVVGKRRETEKRQKRKGEDIGKTAEQEEAESQAAYKHGVSMWNFNLDELKAEAAAIDNEVGGGDPWPKSSLQRKGRGSKSSKKKTAARVPIPARAQSAKIEQKGRFTISDDTPAQQQEHGNNLSSLNEKVTKRPDSPFEEEHNVSGFFFSKEAPAALAHRNRQMCEKMVLFSRQQDDVIRSLREENESLRRRVASWADDRFCPYLCRLNRRAKKKRTHMRVCARIYYTQHTERER